MKKTVLVTMIIAGVMGYNAQAQQAPLYSPGQPSAPMLQPSYPQPGTVPPQPADAQPPSPYPQQQMIVQQPALGAQPYCQPYTDTVNIAGETRITNGTACLRPDGSWELHPLQLGVNYMTRGGVLYMVPSQPFAAVVVADHPHHHRHLQPVYPTPAPGVGISVGIH